MNENLAENVLEMIVGMLQIKKNESKRVRDTITQQGSDARNYENRSYEGDSPEIGYARATQPCDVIGAKIHDWMTAVAVSCN